MINKHKVIYEYIQQCPQVKDLFFNFSKSEKGSTVIASTGKESTVEEYIDGSALKQYDFVVAQYLDLSTVPNSEDNIKAIFDVEQVMNWIVEQDEKGEYPDFGDKCDIIEMSVLQDAPTVAGQDQNGAKYLFSCRVEYFERK